MKLWVKAGFTIIETMLFLGITSLLVMGVLVGTGTSINIQRYRDSVSSLQAILQQQYSDVSNVDNNRDSSWACDNTATPKPTIPGGGIARGQSDCVILGRLITTTDSHTLSIKTIVGYISSYVASDDLKALQNYQIQISPVTSETYEIEWNSSLVQPSGNIPMVFSILILRSPLSGIIRTFIDSNSVVDNSNVKDLINSDALKQSAKMCIDSNGLFTTAKTAVEVMANSASASGVEVLGEATSGC
jgi:type II secretory pathway pseudopilin PulG